MKRSVGKCRVILLVLISMFLIWASGIHLQAMEKDFSTQFSYPLNTPDFMDIVSEFRETSGPAPLNTIYASIKFINTGDSHAFNCDSSNSLLILVKSSPSNVKNRDAIRQTWKIAPNGISTKTLFFIGQSSSERLDNSVKQESLEYGDIIEYDAMDNYYNNTLKTMMEIRYAMEHCSGFQYALLIDDDYFLSVKNLYEFALNNNNDEDILYAGYTMSTRPLRHRFFNKWFIDLEEYAFNRWPPYVTAGAILLSRSALADIYYASFFVQHFRFDDIYLALCAKKMNIIPIHSEKFKFWDDGNDSPQKDLIAAHGYRDTKRLISFWNVQKKNSYV